MSKNFICFFKCHVIDSSGNGVVSHHMTKTDLTFDQEPTHVVIEQRLKWCKIDKIWSMDFIKHIKVQTHWNVRKRDTTRADAQSETGNEQRTFPARWHVSITAPSLINYTIFCWYHEDTWMMSWNLLETWTTM